MVLAKNGVLYRHGQRQPPTECWELSTIAPDGRHALLFRNNRSRIFCPQTGDAWEYSVPGENMGGDSTLDGRYALAWTKINLPMQVRQLLTGNPSLERLSSGAERTYLSLYERPGRLRARLLMRVQSWYGNRGIPDEWWWFPSPDGHAIALTIAGSNGCRCLLFRW
jgi:hypothetical protein